MKELMDRLREREIGLPISDSSSKNIGACSEIKRETETG
jgi:hypothetical protein